MTIPRLISNHAITACFIVFLLVFLMAWSFGGSPLYPWQISGLEIGQNKNGLAWEILFNIRLPRVICACLVGAALSAAGVITQGLFRNPLASPSVIGVSSGGVLGSVLAFYFLLDKFYIWANPIFAFIGCSLTMLLVLFFARAERGFAMNELLLIGFAINGILNACSSFVLSLSLNEMGKAPAIMNWMLGTLNGKTWEHCWLAVIPILAGLILCYRLSYRLNMMSLGIDTASALGVNLSHLRTECILVISLLVATSVSLGGLLPFIGLIVPHLSRLIIGPDNRPLLTLSIINGMTLLILADLFARTLMTPLEIQVGVIISLIGSPLFLWMLYQRRWENYSA